jgi:hypothetical protein
LDHSRRFYETDKRPPEDPLGPWEAAHSRSRESAKAATVKSTAVNIGSTYT